MKKLYLLKQWNPDASANRGDWEYAYVIAVDAAHAVRLFLKTHDEVGPIEVAQMPRKPKALKVEPKALKPMEQVRLTCGATLRLIYSDDSYTRISVEGLPITKYTDGSEGILAATDVLQEVVDFLNRVIATRTTVGQQQEGYAWHHANEAMYKL